MSVDRFLGFSDANLGEMTMEGATADAELFCRHCAIAGAFLEGLVDHGGLDSGKIHLTLSRWC